MTAVKCYCRRPADGLRADRLEPRRPDQPRRVQDHAEEPRDRAGGREDRRADQERQPRRYQASPRLRLI